MGGRTFVEVAGGTIEVEVYDGPPDASTLVFLHEGLGSIDLWRGFATDVRRFAGEHTTVLYSRHGHGRSAPAVVPRPVDYMHHEADVVLPEMLSALGIERPVLVGHSDGASIALLFAGAGHQVAALVCIAPHVFVEPASIAGIDEARTVFESTDMAERMRRYHADPAATFFGWNDVWRSPEFLAWNIEDRLPGIHAPMLIIQGTGDQYGTVAQVDAIESGSSGRCKRLVIDGAGHAPHLEHREMVAQAIGKFVRSRAA